MRVPLPSSGSVLSSLMEYELLWSDSHLYCARQNGRGLFESKVLVQKQHTQRRERLCGPGVIFPCGIDVSYAAKRIKEV